MNFKNILTQGNASTLLKVYNISVVHESPGSDLILQHNWDTNLFSLKPIKNISRASK